MNYYLKYLKYKSKYLKLNKTHSQENYIFEQNEHPLADLKKYNFLQSGGGLPKMYDTPIPGKIESFLMSSENKIGIVYAPTGYGKTVTGCRIIAKVVNEFKKEGRKVIGEILMPFRVSVKEMYTYLNKLGEEQKETLKYGYAMGGGDKKTDETDDATVQTVGYWKYKFLENINDTTEKIIMLDEAHDISWETDFVLNMLLWKISKGANIKLLISSATLDVAKIETLYGIKTEVFDISAELTNQDHYFNRESFLPLNNSRNGDLNIAMAKLIYSALKNKIIDKHILVLMPGEPEIKSLIKLLKENKLEKIPDKCLLLPLYSSLPPEQIRLAIEDNEKRKIIIATNMVENAITINGLSATIDCCLRKELYTDENCIDELKLVMASQSNIKQTAGRSGRQGKKGQAYYVINKMYFDSLPLFSLNQVDKSPVYQQLIILIKNNLPFREILKSVQPEKILKNIDYLIENEIIIASKDSYILTKKGEIVSNLIVKLPVANFIAHCILKKTADLDKNYYHYVSLISAWIEIGKSIFNIFSNFKYRKFIVEDSLETFLNIWIEYTKAENKIKWCQTYDIMHKSMKDINDKMNSILHSLTFYRIREKKIDLTDDIKSSHIKSILIDDLIKSFHNFKLRWNYSDSYENSIEQSFKIDKNNITEPSEYILGLTFFKNNSNIYITNFVNRIQDAEDIQIQERKRLFEEELLRVEEERQRLEEERQRLEEERQRLEEERILRQEEEERQRKEEERQRQEKERLRKEEEEKRLRKEEQEERIRQEVKETLIRKSKLKSKKEIKESAIEERRRENDDFFKK